ncbi:MAG TPA: peptidylprolyl isomerase [Acidimicrobiales bacterium]|nr:peptidylprolyl isomerase [Acidimicrobiales bacterium]
MRRLSFSLPALAVTLALGATACGSVAPYAAKVDNHSISQNALETELRSIAANGPYLKLVESKQPVTGTGAGTFDAAFTALALTRQIYYQLIATELAKRKLVVGPSDLSAARATVIEQIQGEDVFKDFTKAYQDELIRRQAQLDRLTLSLNGTTGSVDDAAKAYYDAHQDQFATACVSHILVDSQAKADDISARLARGEDFAAIAKTDSIDTQSATMGGSLGCDITQDTGFVPEFLTAVFSQPVGVVGPPVQTQFGFHLIKVTSRDIPPFDKVKDQAHQKLAASGQDKLLAWLQDTIGKAKIAVNPKYGTFDKTGSSPGVVPPARPADTTPTTAAVGGVTPAPGVGASGGLPNP